MTIQSKITAKGQTTIPAEVRAALGLKPGDRIAYIIRDGKVEMLARNLRAIDLVGIMGPPPSGKSLSIEEMDDAIAEAVTKDYHRIFPDSRVGQKSRKGKK